MFLVDNLFSFRQFRCITSIVHINFPNVNLTVLIMGTNKAVLPKITAWGWSLHADEATIAFGSGICRCTGGETLSTRFEARLELLVNRSSYRQVCISVGRVATDEWSLGFVVYMGRYRSGRSALIFVFVRFALCILLRCSIWSIGVFSSLFSFSLLLLILFII